MNRLNTIGIFGGTFDPIHFGHLRAALEIHQQFNLDETRLIPCKHPPHRSAPIASADDRLAMVQLAVLDTALSVDDREMHREGPSYTVDTLMSLRREYPKASLCLIVGSDAFLGLSTWHEWEKLIQLANIIVMIRTGSNVPETGPMVNLLSKHALTPNEQIADFSAGKIVYQKITSLDISATAIRTLIQKEKSPQFLLPVSVFDYIKQHALYHYKENTTP